MVVYGKCPVSGPDSNNLSNEERKEENEKKKAFLNSYRKAREELNRLEEERQEVRLNKLLPSQVVDGMPHGSGGSDLSAYAARIDEIERRIYAAQYQCIKTLLSVKNAIDEMEEVVLFLARFPSTKKRNRRHLGWNR